jgi:hypothetical protein
MNDVKTNMPEKLIANINLYCMDIRDLNPQTKGLPARI